MLDKVRFHQLFFFALGLTTILLSQSSAIFGLNELASSLGAIFLVIMSLGVSHGATDAIVIWDSFNQFKYRFYVFLVYFLIVIAAFFLWLVNPVTGLILLLMMSIFHFGTSDLQYLKVANKKIIFFWGIVMTFLPIIFYPSDVKIIFDSLVDFDLNLEIFTAIRFFTEISFFSLMFLIFINKKIHLKNKAFLIIELLMTLALAKFLTPLLWFTFYFCLLHGFRAFINFKTTSFRNLCLIVIFTLPVLFFSYYLIGTGFQSNYIGIIFPILMALTVAHMLLPTLNKFFIRLLLNRQNF